MGCQRPSSPMSAASVARHHLGDLDREVLRDDKPMQYVRSMPDRASDARRCSLTRHPAYVHVHLTAESEVTTDVHERFTPGCCCRCLCRSTADGAAVFAQRFVRCVVFGIRHGFVSIFYSCRATALGALAFAGAAAFALTAATVPDAAALALALATTRTRSISSCIAFVSVEASLVSQNTCHM